MIIWIFSLFLFPRHSTSDSQYECGPHGRFEYCIDGIPGCVIGCHCHPGYFFDTDTKICEPNTKLTQDFRRHYLLEPTRIQDSPFIYPTAANDPSTTTNPIDDKVDEITKDADDIGDWLYNQFFKTIENQVINKTKGDEPLTRRSGSGPNKKPKRRSHKNRKRNKRKRKKGLKSKLLRITQDDSLFDSSSGSTSDEDSSSSGSSSSSSGETDSSFETYKDNTKNDKDHGHKKIVIFNKKPKPPLPSFIFLPNIETPFYPPIGLPPPPAVPMYPMVPVPPVGPMFPYQGVPPKCEDDEVTAMTTTNMTTTDVNGLTTPTPTTTTSATPSITTTDFTTSDTTTTIVSGSTAQPPNLRSNKAKYGNKFKGKKAKLRKEEQSDNDQEAMLWNNFKQGPQNNFMQKLRQKMKAMNNKPYTDQFQEAESPLLDLDISTESFSNPNLLQFNTEDKSSPKQRNVNFKYLSQFIHRVDGNKTNSPLLSLNQNRRINTNQVPQRRMNNFYDSNLIPGYGQPSERIMEERMKWNEPNDSYYSNLGRQIATMIRNIDSKGERQVNIEIEQGNSEIPSNPVFFENSYAPRSYWERSVRSPLRYYISKIDEFENSRNSDENLLSLENQVEFAATTARSLSLKELENIIRTLGKAQSQVREKNIYINNSKSKTNRFSLLPKNEQVRNENDNYNIDYRNDTVLYLTTIKPDNLQFYNRRLASGILMNSHNLTPWTNKALDKTNKHTEMFYNMNPPKKPNAIEIIPRDSLLKKLHIAQPSIPKIMKVPIIKVTTQKPGLKYQLKPMQLNYRGMNYYSNNENHNLVGKASYPVYPNEFKPKQFGQPAKQSYFHRSVHHFDYFDE